MGFRRQTPSLACGEVAAGRGKLQQVVGEGTLQTEQVRALDIRQYIFRVGCVAAVAVYARSIAATRQLGDAETVGGHRVHQRECIHCAALAFKDPVHALTEVHLMPLYRKLYVVAREGEGSLYHLARTLGSHYRHRLCATAKMHGAQQPRQPEEMVAMQVRDNHCPKTLQFQMVVAYAVLRSLGAVDEQLEAIGIEHLGAAAPHTRGQGCTRPQYRHVKIHTLPPFPTDDSHNRPKVIRPLTSSISNPKA